MTYRNRTGFVVFCLIAGSRWLVDGSFPARLPLFEAASLHYLLVGLAASFILIVQRRPLAAMPIPWLQLAIASLLLLSVPTLLGDAAGSVSDATRIGLFALVPLLVVVGASSFGKEMTQSRVLMMPALIGLSGVLLLIPFQFPSSPSGDLSFAVSLAAVLCTASGSLWVYSLLRRCGWVLALVILCLANALVMGLMAAVTHGLAVPLAGDLLIELLRCAVLDLPLLFLLVWMLQEVSPTRLATRFLLIPLLSAVEGAVLLHAPIDLQFVSGIVLIVISSSALLFWRAPNELEGTSFLGLR